MDKAFYSAILIIGSFLMVGYAIAPDSFPVVQKAIMPTPAQFDSRTY
jgi:hypothetical protein